MPDVMASTPATAPMACIVGSSAVRLWGLEGGERLRRQARAVGLGIADSVASPPTGWVLLARADYLFEERTLRDLAGRPGTLLLAVADAGASVAVAAHVPAAAAASARAVLEGAAAPDRLADVTLATPATLSAAFVAALLKSAPPLLLPVRATNAAALERHLFDGSYKGVTDLVTKWVWPAPARAVTRWCARLGIGPNAVTAMSLVLRWRRWRSSHAGSSAPVCWRVGS
jgi:hypothetical protein